MAGCSRLLNGFETSVCPRYASHIITLLLSIATFDHSLQFLENCIERQPKLPDMLISELQDRASRDHVKPCVVSTGHIDVN